MTSPTFQCSSAPHSDWAKAF